MVADLTKARRATAWMTRSITLQCARPYKGLFTETKYNLIERAAQAVCEAVLAEHEKVEKITLLLKKPEAP